MKVCFNVFLLLTSLSVDHVYSNCHFIDAYWKVDYTEVSTNTMTMILLNHLKSDKLAVVDFKWCGVI